MELCGFTDGTTTGQSPTTIAHEIRLLTSYHREQAPFDTTTCNGSGDLKKAQYYSNGPDGMTVVEEQMEIACTQMS